MSVCPVSSPQKSETREMHETSESETKENEGVGVWDCGSPLYDSYELVSLTHLIERHLMTLPTLGGSKRLLAATTKTKFYYPYDASNIIYDTRVSSSSSSSSSSCSIVGMLGEFVARKMRKKRVTGTGLIRKEKRKTSKLGVCGFSDRFGFSKNQNCF